METLKTLSYNLTQKVSKNSKNMYKTNWYLRLVIVIMCLGTMIPSFSQTLQLTGSVKTKGGESLPGVSIIEKGTLNGTVTNIDGNFSIAVSADAKSLVLTFVGYQAKEVVLNGQSNIDVIMDEDVLGLDEVIVVGYGEMKKSDLTGSVSTVKVEKLSSIPANSIEGVLQGRVTGMQVVNSSQEPGAGSTIRIRGASSFSGANDPLVVVDGFPIGSAGDLKQVNPNDIQSVEVLKDASASAIYGSRGANGVIMITTKRAKAGSFKVEVNQQSSFKSFTSKLLRWEDPLLMAHLSNERDINDGRIPTYSGQTITGVYYPTLAEIANSNVNTDWGKVAFRDNPLINNTTVSMRGANETTSFNISGNYLLDEGVYIEDDYKKYIINIGVSHKFNDYFKVTTSNILSRNVRDYNSGLAYWRNPLFPVYDENGDYYRSSSQDFDHPLATTENVMNTSKGLDVISSYLFELNLGDHFDIKSQLNYKFGNSISDKYSPKNYTWEGFYFDGVAEINNWQNQEILTETFATYKNTFNEIHNLNVMVGHSYQNNISRTSGLRATGFVNEALGNESMQAGDPESNVVTNGLQEVKLLSFYGRANYNLSDKYLFTATMRTDGSSKFGENNKWAYFPSGAVSWKLHNEEFIKNLGTFDVLKARFSYGISGNQGISPYQTLSRYGIENFYNAGKWNTAIGPGYISRQYGPDLRYNEWSGIPNKDLKWESTSQMNFGLDIALLDRRLRATVDLYSKETNDLLRERYLPLSSSYTKFWVNDGTILNQGIEVMLEGNILSTEDMSLTSTIMFSKNKNEVTDLGGITEGGLLVDTNTGMEYEFKGEGFDYMGMAIANIYGIGQPLNVFYGYKVDGIIQSKEEGLASGLSDDLAQPGEFKYVDINDDGVIDENDRAVIGDPNPDFMASLGLDFTYKNFDLSVFFNGVFGNDVFYPNKLNQANVMPMRWTLDNPNNDYPKLKTIRDTKLSDWFIEDGSFVRIQNLTLGYNFNVDRLDFVSKARLYVNASNLYTFSGFKGYDPEVGLDGIYSGGYPRLRTTTIGLNITF